MQTFNQILVVLLASSIIFIFLGLILWEFRQRRNLELLRSGWSPKHSLKV